MLNYFKKKWRADATSQSMASDETVSLISKELGLTRVSSQLLVNRGYNTVESAKEFLMKS